MLVTLMPIGMGTMRTNCGADPYFVYINLHFMLRQAPFLFTIAKNGRAWACVKPATADFAHAHVFN